MPSRVNGMSRNRWRLRTAAMIRRGRSPWGFPLGVVKPRRAASSGRSGGEPRDADGASGRSGSLSDSLAAFLKADRERRPAGRRRALRIDASELAWLLSGEANDLLGMPLFAPALPPSMQLPLDAEPGAVLPCGLKQAELMDLMYRDLKPEDYSLLSKLDENVPNRNTASEASIDQLPRRRAVELLKETAGAESRCGVCLVDFEPECEVVQLPCAHGFHTACITRWLAQCKNTCPLCGAAAVPRAADAAKAAPTAAVAAVA
eukprot:TRINITY_DN37158_c0_g1_i1.p2 TRINITY_DN37158_c0_g1~~TRINITY_DN37158_c0_g1_i1.p2  ORF type:complete len:261 (+),score=57.01 TRINITY_DN37158_c0_g1_i1:129-911(+)